LYRFCGDHGDSPGFRHPDELCESGPGAVGNPRWDEPRASYRAFIWPLRERRNVRGTNAVRLHVRLRSRDGWYDFWYLGNLPRPERHDTKLLRKDPGTHLGPGEGTDTGYVRDFGAFLCGRPGRSHGGAFAGAESSGAVRSID